MRFNIQSCSSLYLEQSIKNQRVGYLYNDNFDSVQYKVERVVAAALAYQDAYDDVDSSPFYKEE